MKRNLRILMKKITTILLSQLFLVSCSNSNAITSLVNSSSKESISSSSSIEQKPIESSVSYGYFPAETEFKYIFQSWENIVNNTGKVSLPNNSYFKIEGEPNKEIIYSFDAQGYGEGEHGKRVYESMNHYYPGYGFQAVSGNSFYLNNKSLDPKDTNNYNVYVESPEIPAGLTHYALALSMESAKNYSSAKIFTTSSDTINITYQRSAFEYDINALGAWRVYQGKDGNNYELPVLAYQYAKWIDSYAPKHNTLIVKSLENTSVDDRNPLPNGVWPTVDCNPTYIEGGGSGICDAGATAIIQTDYGIDNFFMVGYFNQNFNRIQGYATGKWLDHIIFSHENSIDDSNSFTTPTVAGFIASLITLRKQNNLPELKASDWKKIIFSTSDLKNTNYISGINPAVGQIITAPIYVKVLNKTNAQSCALTLQCLNP